MLSTLIADLQEHAEFYHTAALNTEEPALTEFARARTQQSLDFIAELEAATQAASQTKAEQQSAESDHATPDDGPLAGLRRGVTTVTAAMTIERDKTDLRVLEDARQADERLLESYVDARRQALSPALQRIVERQHNQLQAAVTYTDVRKLNSDDNLVLGQFKSSEEATHAVKALEEDGYGQDHVGVIARDVTVSDLLEDRRMDLAGSSAGATSLGGTALGGLFGLLAGVGIVMLPGLGPVAALGAGATILGVTAIGAGIGATYGAIFGMLIGWGIAEDDVHRFLRAVEDGNILVSVQAPADEAGRVGDRLREAGATDVIMRTAEQTNLT